MLSESSDIKLPTGIRHPTFSQLPIHEKVLAVCGQNNLYTKLTLNLLLLKGLSRVRNQIAPIILGPFFQDSHIRGLF